MTVSQCAFICNADILNNGEGEISSFFACDLLSHALARLKPGSGLITVIANENTVAVAKLKNASCLIFSDGILPGDSVILCAQRENIPVLATKLSTYEVCKRVAQWEK